MTETVTLHASNGLILQCIIARQPIDSVRTYEQTFPWAWIATQDHRKVKAAIAKAASGSKVTCTYQLNPALYGGKGWMVTTEWQPTLFQECPVIGISRTYDAGLAKLTSAEKTLFKLIPSHDNRGIAALLNIKSSSVRSEKSRLARKLKIKASQLTAFCAAYSDIL